MNDNHRVVYIRERQHRDDMLWLQGLCSKNISSASLGLIHYNPANGMFEATDGSIAGRIRASPTLLKQLGFNHKEDFLFRFHLLRKTKSLCVIEIAEGFNYPSNKLDSVAHRNENLRIAMVVDPRLLKQVIQHAEPGTPVEFSYVPDEDGTTTHVVHIQSRHRNAWMMPMAPVEKPTS